jgi:hypothetical protein
MNALRKQCPMLSGLLLAGCLALAGPAMASTAAPKAAGGATPAAMPAPFMLTQQWPPEGGQGYPMQQGMQPGMQQGMPMHQQPYAGGGGQMLNDPMGHYRLTLPQGAMPVGAVLNFMVPSAGAQVSISSFAQPQMVQMYAQNYPGMLQQMGATIDTRQQINHHGQQGQLIGATMRNPQGGGSMHSMTVFLPSSSVMIQVMGPEQNAPQMGQLMTQILNGLQ